MAKFELKFLSLEDQGWIKTQYQENQSEEYIYVEIYNPDINQSSSVYLDKSTAIKFAKTLRTEINKITEKEGQDGDR
jgi:hypothetical protein